MAHELVGTRFVSRAVPAWHNLGRVFDVDENLNALDALREIATGIVIAKIPLVLPFGDEMLETGQSAIVRLPIVGATTKEHARPEVFGVVAGNRYDIVQYVDLGERLAGLPYPVETAGILRDGRLAFISFRAESFDVLGVARERVDNYVVVVFSQEPGQAHKILHTRVRVVCRNTLSYAETEAQLNLSIPHSSIAAEVLTFAAEVAAGLDRKIAASKAAFDAMARTPLGDDSFIAIVQAAYPEPKRPKNLTFLATSGISIESLADRDDKTFYDRIRKAHDAWEYRRAREAKRRELAALCLATINEECPEIAGSVYAGYQAVTEASDWREGKGDADYSTLLGPRADEKSRAYSAALRLAGFSSN